MAAALAHADRLLAASPAKAAEQASEILKAVPGHPHALLILGVAQRRLGDNAAARAVLETLAATQPRAAAAHYEYGLTLAALGEAEAAIAAIRRATGLNPAMPDAWRALGDLLMLAGDEAGADQAYARHIGAAVNDKRLMAAGLALCDRDIPAAERLLRAHLARFPTDVAAMRMLAEAATRLGQFGEAEALLADCLKRAPSFIGARHNYAMVLYRQNKLAEAIPHIERLVAHDPRDPNYRNLLAAAVASVGDYQRAIDLYEGVLRQFPRQPKIWLGYGHALKTAGRTADGVRAYRKSLELEPSLGEAYWSLANLKTVRFPPADLGAMEALLRRPGLGREDTYHTHYALGRAYEEQGDYAQSFSHYAAGARIRLTEAGYSADETTGQVDRLISLFSAAFFAERAGAGCQDPAPIFVVGLPRSGSTLIEQILASHSAVEGTMELQEMPRIARSFGRGLTGTDGPRYPESLAPLQAGALTALGEDYIRRSHIYRKLDRPFFIDKLPNNWLHTGLIRLILPHAKIIDARRHPLATCFSAFKQHFARGQNFSYDLTDVGRYYCDYVRLMAHMDLVQPGLVHRVQYETMVADTEGEIRRLLAFCGLEFEPACLRFWETDRAVRTASSEQVRRPIFTEGLEQWRNFEAWLGPLKEALGKCVLF